MAKSWLFLLVLVGIGIGSSPAMADSSRLEACTYAAAKYRNLDPLVLKAISIQESGLRLDAVNINRDKNNNVKSVDHGPFQINDQWLPKLSKWGITKEKLYDACVAPYVAAWILAQAIKQHGPTWRAVGAYHSPTPSRQESYSRLIRKHYQRLVAAQR